MLSLKIFKEKCSVKLADFMKSTYKCKDVLNTQLFSLKLTRCTLARLKGSLRK